MEGNLTRRDFGKAAMTGGVAVLTLGSAIELEGCSTSWITVAINDLPIIVNIADSILGIVAVATGNGALSGAIGAIINGITVAVKAGLQTVQNLINTYEKNKQPGTLNAILDALTTLQTNLSQIIATIPAGISTAVSTTIATAIALAISTISAIQLLIPSAVPKTAVADPRVMALAPKAVLVKQGVAKFELPNKNNLQTMYNSVLVMNGYAGQQI